MIDNEPFDWASLESDVIDGEFRPATRTSTGPTAKTQQFPCGGCGGTGQWRGRGKCFACNGRGLFKTSEQDRRNARVKAQASKMSKIKLGIQAFDAANPGVVKFLGEATWSSFAQELLAKLNQYGSLTEGQLNAVRNMMAKVEASRAAKAQERAAGGATVDLAPIRAMFEAAVKSGHKRPVYRASGLVISRAPDTGKNPGALYVKTEADEYLGKLLGTVYSGRPAPALTAIAADPKGEAIRYGQRTGRCSCCGRELTVEASINAGIGPICAEKWGL